MDPTFNALIFTAQTVRPKVTVGIPVRNGGEMLATALESILQQTERDIEIVISDNASDDGSTDLLRSAASKDERIRYVRQERAISAYDNFRYVLKMARGEYFMWAAHDDTRDLNYVSLLTEALAKDEDAVVAFGDLNIVTPNCPKGTRTKFDFETINLGAPFRLIKISRRQCFYIYGVWRTAAIRCVPYAYCTWWPDLPMMLAAGYLGTFIHVPGVSFNYYEIPKSNLDRIMKQDFKARFSLIAAVVAMIKATYIACSGVGGNLVGIYCSSLVILKQFVNLPGFLYRRLRHRLVIFGRSLL